MEIASVKICGEGSSTLQSVFPWNKEKAVFNAYNISITMLFGSFMK